MSSELFCLELTLPRHILFLQLPVIMSGHSSDNEVDESKRARWEGSEVSSAEIAWLKRTRRIPEGVEC